MNNDILVMLDENTNELLKSVALFTPEQFNKVPFEGSWTAAQVAEHLLKSESNVPDVWNGNTEITQRDPEEKSAILRNIFLDFSTKIKSPEFILPSDKWQEPDSLYNALKENRSKIRNLVEEKDLTLTFTDFSFPQLGELTGMEWATFVICHAIRHTRQLNNIYKEIE